VLHTRTRLAFLLALVAAAGLAVPASADDVDFRLYEINHPSLPDLGEDVMVRGFLLTIQPKPGEIWDIGESHEIDWSIDLTDVDGLYLNLRPGNPIPEVPDIHVYYPPPPDDPNYWAKSFVSGSGYGPDVPADDPGGMHIWVEESSEKKSSGHYTSEHTGDSEDSDTKQKNWWDYTDPDAEEKERSEREVPIFYMNMRITSSTMIQYEREQTRKKVVAHTGSSGSYSECEITFDYVTGRLEIVPEPATLSLLALGGLALTRRRRK